MLSLGGFPQNLFASSFPRAIGSTWSGSCRQHPDVSAGWLAGFSVFFEVPPREFLLAPILPERSS